ncbi:hypothetical protein CVT26_003505 [Gymnopilus dilepis]|uniref:Uncharacterized protein n=1 Tax=Gymnopilus dilepis TaxID=231916 RepID=A0A409W2X9_9AGAR|nr:hypothetical protein CVT26_003505 [Gymnopilus dilepis]
MKLKCSSFGLGWPTPKPAIAFYGLDCSDLVTLVQTIKAGQYTSARDLVPPPCRGHLCGRSCRLSYRPCCQRTRSAPIFLIHIPYNVLPFVVRRDFGARLQGYNGIVYLYDIIDDRNCLRAKAELDNIIPDDGRTKPVLILIPRQPGSVDMDGPALIKKYSLEERVERAPGKVAVFGCCLTPTETSGYQQGEL